MYIINTLYKKNNMGGYRLCSIHHIGIYGINDITNEIAKKGKFKMDHKNIKIPFGSGTGRMVLSAYLESIGILYTQCYNISVL